MFSFKENISFQRQGQGCNAPFLRVFAFMAWLGLALVLPLVSSGQGWSNGGANPARNARVQAYGPLNDSLRWTISRPGLFGMPSYIDQNRVVTMRFLSLTMAPVECYDLNNGALMWSVDVTGGTGRSLPVGLRDGRVFVVRYTESLQDSLFALDLMTGNRLWASPVRVAPYIGSSVSFTPAGHLLIEGNLKIYCINATNGQLVYQFSSIPFASGGGEISVSPTTNTGYTLEQIGGVSYLWATDIATGSRLYNHIVNDTYPGGALPQAPLMVGSNGIVYVHKQEDHIAAFQDNGQQLVLLWERPIRGNAPFSHMCVGASGSLYIPSNGKVWRLNPQTGVVMDSSIQVVNNVQLFQMRASSDARGHVYVTNGENQLYAFDSTLNLLWFNTIPFVNISGASIASDGTVLVSGAGQVRAYRPSPPPTEVSGTLTYNNAFQTPLSNTQVNLLSGTQVIASVTTGASGNFSLLAPLQGSYGLSGVCTKPWGGVNGADALAINRHFSGNVPLTGLRLKAGDVNGNSAINSQDALLVSRRFTGAVSGFNVGDWCIESLPVTIGTGSVVQNLLALCYGDVNGSHSAIPPRSSRTLAWRYEGKAHWVDKECFFSVSADQFMHIGAASLVVDLPPGARISGVTSRLPGSNFEYNQLEQQLRVVWWSLDGVKLEAGDPLFDIRMLSENKGLDFPSINLESELSTVWAEALESASLRLPVLVDDPSNSWTIYPNPASDRVFVRGPLSGAHGFRWSIRNLTGQLMNHGHELFMDARIVEIGLGGLAPGIYTLEGQVTSTEGQGKDAYPGIRKLRIN
ncbi:MAG: hypothetical protein FJ338_05220 [Sphingomonadales bacterium]|nr:hypothetical protein [Sphingomonadales bacterium]MBM3931942.1 hypothetical protein [Sphingomonadales bacterium]